MRIDNDGEGGIIALMTLLGVKKAHRPLDRRRGAVRRRADLRRRRDHAGDLGAVRALKAWSRSTPSLTPYVLPAAVVVLLALFAVQPLGTASIGRAFGPIMLVWFVVMALMGVNGVDPASRGAFVALNPWYGLPLSVLRAARPASWCSAASSCA